MSVPHSPHWLVVLGRLRQLPLCNALRQILNYCPSPPSTLLRFLRPSATQGPAGTTLIVDASSGCDLDCIPSTFNLSPPESLPRQLILEYHLASNVHKITVLGYEAIFPQGRTKIYRLMSLRRTLSDRRPAPTLHNLLPPFCLSASRHLVV
jgi:hypothetical protein